MKQKIDMVDTEALKKIFEESPYKSSITVKSECVDCRCEVIIDITITSGGFGLQGGFLLKCLPNGFVVKCLDCYKVDSNMHWSDELLL